MFMSTNRAPRTFAARYNGSCICGASFKKGAQIAWDKTIRRATLCPDCRAPKAVRGPALHLGRIIVRVDTHPVTGAPAVVVLSTMDDPGAEIFRLRGGRWALTAGMVFCGVHNHEEIEAKIAEYTAARTEKAA